MIKKRYGFSVLLCALLAGYFIFLKNGVHTSQGDLPAKEDDVVLNENKGQQQNQNLNTGSSQDAISRWAQLSPAEQKSKAELFLKQVLLEKVPSSYRARSVWTVQQIVLSDVYPRIQSRLEIDGIAVTLSDVLIEIREETSTGWRLMAGDLFKLPETLNAFPSFDPQTFFTEAKNKNKASFDGVKEYSFLGVEWMPTNSFTSLSSVVRYEVQGSTSSKPSRPSKNYDEVWFFDAKTHDLLKRSPRLRN